MVKNFLRINSSTEPTTKNWSQTLKSIENYILIDYFSFMFHSKVKSLLIIPSPQYNSKLLPFITFIYCRLSLYLFLSHISYVQIFIQLHLLSWSQIVVIRTLSYSPHHFCLKIPLGLWFKSHTRFWNHKNFAVQASWQICIQTIKLIRSVVSLEPVTNLIRLKFPVKCHKFTPPKCNFFPDYKLVIQLNLFW